jgi:hypothetical protein
MTSPIQEIERFKGYWEKPNTASGRPLSSDGYRRLLININAMQVSDVNGSSALEGLDKFIAT